MIIPAHDFEILACDWNKYVRRLLHSDGLHGQDHQGLGRQELQGPHLSAKWPQLRGQEGQVLSAPTGPHGFVLLRHDSVLLRHDALVGRYDHHTKFAVGVDMSVLVEVLLTSAGWDELVYVWQHGIDP